MARYHGHDKLSHRLANGKVCQICDLANFYPIALLMTATQYKAENSQLNQRIKILLDDQTERSHVLRLAPCCQS